MEASLLRKMGTRRPLAARARAKRKRATAQASSRRL